MRLPTLANRYAIELRRLREKHDYRVTRDEDGVHLYCNKKVRPSVRRKLAKLAKLSDMARGLAPAHPFDYWDRYNCHGHGRSARTMNKLYSRWGD